MKSIGIFYGSSTGTTSDLAQKIASALGVDSANVMDVANADAAAAAKYDVLLLGSSTWGLGDLQDDWESFLPKLKGENLSGKKVGLFGCGDASSYSDTFCAALGTIKAELANTGCTFIGAYPAEGYSYDETTAEENGQLIGLCVDDANESDQTEARMERWIAAMGL
ncbi:flavodoxin [Porphyromonas gingivalis]|uniref:Flavodoxin n=4 Tax=Porphyromonas gingivalis TaxID=837 RepID=Q7MTT3_PORGI|nr:flavodoxin [Porphyromonas gingivalis]AAQ66847.1 flavodoxin [Porphyromonas gingivalis W83]AKV64914.1 flavodoxin, long chain [Porphyromonas gingivalis]ALA94263.1 flavodoxin, long chain [Porphyromonas gingivalis AJW4]ALJ26183.1 flavodoxin, long chain [Porphyromonas gingivalis 381]ALO30332.1 flavodoxin, long chain [Porphyromonas gingivalis A7A1-28]